MARILTSGALVALGLTFFSCEEASQAPISDAAPAAAAAGAGLNIVFVKVDSLQSGYTAVAEELGRLEANYRKAEENHAGRVQALETEVKQLQNQMQQGLLAPNRVQAEQQRIARREQEILQQRDMALSSIQEDQFRIQQQFSERVKGVLEDLQRENGYDYILNQGQNSAVLITNDAYDITNLVLERLNGVADSIQ